MEAIIVKQALHQELMVMAAVASGEMAPRAMGQPASTSLSGTDGTSGWDGQPGHAL